MAYTLQGTQGDFVLRDSDFPQLLRLAIFYGWKPEGTQNPDHIEIDRWDRNEYLNREGQFVNKNDAFGLSNALEISLQDIPDFDCKDKNWKIELKSKSAGENNQKRKSLHNLIKYFSGKDKHKIREFIDYANRDGFKIC
jgi:hypothetical protein